jgi:hypothetical protein
MSESLSFPEETSPQPELAVFTDILATTEWRELREKAIEAENELVLSEDEDQGSYKVGRRVATLTVELDDIFDQGYINQPCQVLGFAYPGYCLEGARLAGESRPIETKLVDSQEMVFLGTGLFRVAGRWQAMVEMYSPRHTDEMPNEKYYAPLRENSFMTLNIREPGENYEGDSSTAVDALKSLVQASYAFMCSDTFLQLTPAQQREWLEQSTVDLENEVESLQDTNVPVICEDYGIVRDCAPGVMVFASSGDANRAPSAGESFTIAGVIQRFEYSELATLPADKRLTPADFYLNDGMSFMLVRDDDKAETYYVPAQSIIDII